MRPCCRHVCAFSHIAGFASLASFAGFTLDADIANQTHRTHAAWLATYAQSARDADQVDCARLALIAKHSPSAGFASSAYAANPATGKGTATADGLQRSRHRQRLGLLRTISHSFTSRPSPHTSDKHTCIPPLVTAFMTSRSRIDDPERTQLHR
jgi:hypothetical protein